MARCLTAPSHYPNQCWLIINGVPWHSPKAYFTWRGQDCIFLQNETPKYTITLRPFLTKANELIRHVLPYVFNSLVRPIHNFRRFFVRHREHGRKGYAVAIPRFPAQRTSNACSVSISKPLDDTGYRISLRNILRIYRSTRWCQTNRSSHNLRQVSILICIPGADNVRIFIKRGSNTHSHRLPIWHCHIFCFHFLVNL